MKLLIRNDAFEMTLHWIEPAVVGVLTVMVMAAIGRRTTASPKVEQGMLQFRLPKAFVILGGMGIAIGGAFLIAGVMLAMSEWVTAVLLLAVAGMFGYMGIILFRDGISYSVACNEESVAVIHGQRRFDVCLWSDIISARVHPLSKFILLKTNEGRTLKINAYLIGSDALFNMMARKTTLPVANLVAKARAAG